MSGTRYQTLSQSLLLLLAGIGPGQPVIPLAKKAATLREKPFPAPFPTPILYPSQARCQSIQHAFPVDFRTMDPAPTGIAAAPFRAFPERQCIMRLQTAFASKHGRVMEERFRSIANVVCKPEAKGAFPMGRFPSPAGTGLRHPGSSNFRSVWALRRRNASRAGCTAINSGNEGWKCPACCRKRVADAWKRAGESRSV